MAQQYAFADATEREIRGARRSFKAMCPEWGPLQDLYLDIIEDLQYEDLQELERKTKRWGRKGVSGYTLCVWRYSLFRPDGVKFPHARTLSVVAEALGYEITWTRETPDPTFLRRVK